MKTAKELELLLLVKEKKIQELTLELDHEKSTVADYGRRIIKAINFIEYYRDKFHYNLINSHLDKIIKILEGKMYE